MPTKSISESSEPSNRGKVLVVDDDDISRVMLGHQLKIQKYDVVCASSAAEALVLLQKQGPNSFNCIISDYYMPGQNGLEFLLRAKELDASLAFMMVTGAGEKQLVADSLRCGATDYLEKPVRGKDLSEATQRAVTETIERRRLARNDTDAKAIGTMQLLLGPSTKSMPSRLEVYHYPCHGAGGDFSNAFRLPDGSLLVLAADVSGHDLKAAFISAYFQGIVRGMITRQTPIPEILSFFNQLLIEEWGAEAGKSMGTSLAVCAVQVDFTARTIDVFNNGFPIPVQVSPSGESQPAGLATEYPLGWFPETVPNHTKQAIIEGAHLYLWTDGLEDFACHAGISPWALAAKLLLIRGHAHTKDFLSSAPDDIMLLRIELTPETNKASGDDVFILNERLTGNRLAEIDVMQEFWRRSILFVLPKIDGNFLLDLLLCCREGVINALRYGCQAQPSQSATLLLALTPESGRLRMVISDPGAGHDFDFEAHLKVANEEMIPEHRGLGMMKEISNEMCFRRNRAEVELIFKLNSGEVRPITMP